MLMSFFQARGPKLATCRPHLDYRCVLFGPPCVLKFFKISNNIHIERLHIETHLFSLSWNIRASGHSGFSFLHGRSLSWGSAAPLRWQDVSRLLIWMPPPPPAPRALTFPASDLSPWSLVYMLISWFNCLPKTPCWRPAPSTFAHHHVLPTCSLHCASVCGLSCPSLQTALLLLCIGTSLPELAKCPWDLPTSQDPLPFGSFCWMKDWLYEWMRLLLIFHFFRSPIFLWTVRMCLSLSNLLFQPCLPPLPSEPLSNLPLQGLPGPALEKVTLFLSGGSCGCPGRSALPRIPSSNSQLYGTGICVPPLQTQLQTGKSLNYPPPAPKTRFPS